MELIRRKRNNRAHRQRGMALVIVLLLLALLTTITVEVLFRQDRFLTRNVCQQHRLGPQRDFDRSRPAPHR